VCESSVVVVDDEHRETSPLCAYRQTRHQHVYVTSSSSVSLYVTRTHLDFDFDVDLKLDLNLDLLSQNKRPLIDLDTCQSVRHLKKPCLSL